MLDQYASFKIYLGIGTGGNDFMVEIMKVPYCVSDYEFIANKFISQLAVIGRLRPKLRLTWPELLLDHRYAKLQLRLPTEIPLTWNQAKIVRSIISQDHYRLFYTKDASNTMTILPLKDTVWAANNPPRPPTGMIAVAREIHSPPPLYPQLTDPPRH
jgi:hypothetical protein